MRKFQNRLKKFSMTSKNNYSAGKNIYYPPSTVDQRLL
ncbi:hypothetical protein CRE_13665 [Caenorhabditis remanei]|uniref:Uncharacterized protein n=1 Tax=Caenorhabditis remanei TaxID=31234 RepID=E3N7J7_CAERE|nr:hypothetical protein CRE_13665 [Caenorhabditis remanei]